MSDRVSVKVYLTTDSHAGLIRHADRFGLSLSAFLRVLGSTSLAELAGRVLERDQEPQTIGPKMDRKDL